MKSRTVIKTSILPASKDTIFSLLKELKTLQYVASPLVTFIPLNGNENLSWKKDTDLDFHFKLFSFLPFGIHTIRVVKFDETSNEIYTNEKNKHIPIWNHRIILKEISPNETEYTDEVEIYSGWKTPVIYLWAKYFYAHRHRRWLKLLNKLKQDLTI